MKKLLKSTRWLMVLMTACAVPESALRGHHELAEDVVSSWEEGCEHPQSLVLRCQEGVCSFFRCRFPEEVLLAFRGGFPSPPVASPRRWWGRPVSGSEQNEPVLTFRFHETRPKPPIWLLPPGRYVRHHVFAQAPDLATWFTRQGIKDIHQFTLVIPESVHQRIHSGARGGLWNAAWRQFRDSNPRAPAEAIYRHAGELIFRFELTGSVVPYRQGR